MEFNIEGADVKTGRSRVLRVEADDEQQAEAKARELGVLASNVFARPTRLTDEIPLKEPPPPAPSRPPMPAARAHAQAAAVERETNSHSQAYSTDSQPSESERPPMLIAPDYAGLRTASLVLHIMAVMLYLVGLLAVLGGLYEWFTAGFSYAQVVLSYAGLGCIAGAVMHGMSACCDALRDIARNSFRQ